MKKDGDEPSKPARPQNSTSNPFTTPFTFTQIIDADHFTIERLATRIRKLPPLPNTTIDSSTLSIHLSALKPLLLEATWRLIRHDFSEEIVMRPAFAQVLGEQGVRMAEHDRSDHAEGRKGLLEILGRVAALESALNGGGRDLSGLEREFNEVMSMVTTAFDDLGKHMAIESGEFLPFFEGVIDEDISRRLAREYSRTLVMSPFVSVSRVSSLADQKSRRRNERTLVFDGGVLDYVHCALERMKVLYEQVLEDAKRDDETCLKQEVNKEIERLQVGKWLSMNERKALRDSGERAQEADLRVGKL